MEATKKNLEERLKKIEEMVTKGDFAQIVHSLKWLQSDKVNTTYQHINFNATSYGYKHKVERWAGMYISNDNFILACRLAELNEKQVSPVNYCYNIYLDGEKPKPYRKGIYEYQQYK